MGRTYAAVVAAAVLWGANFPLAALLVTEMDPIAGAAARFLIAGLVMLAAAWWREEPVAAALKSHGGAYAVVGLVGIAGFNLLFFLAMRHTSAVNGALIMATNPLVTALVAAPVLGERPSPRHLMALPVALAGVAAVVLGGAGSLREVSLGDLMMIAANLCWAAYNVLTRKLMPTSVPQMTSVALTLSAGALALSAAAVVGGGPLGLPGPKGGAALAMIALGGSVLAYLFWTAGIARLGAGRTALFLNLVPVTAILITAAAGTLPTMAQAAGGVAVIVAVSLAMLPGRSYLSRRST